MHLDAPLILQVGQASAAGIKEDNEDSLGIKLPDGPLLTTKGAVAVVADGVSAAEAGKEASDICVTSFLTDYFSTPETWSVKKSAQKVLSALNTWLYRKGKHFHSAEKGYVSTLSILIIKSRVAHIFHVGDSRIYRWRRGKLQQLTHDHAVSLGNGGSHLTRAMGLDISLHVDYHTVDIECDDKFFLSTDGVHGFMSDQSIGKSLGKKTDHYEELCHQLLDQALANGSDDNISCQIIHIKNLPFENTEDFYQSMTTLPFPPALHTGMVIDGFRIQKEIYASQKSQLYLAKDDSDGKLCVIKTPSVNYEDDIAYIDRFITESWIARRLNHENIVKVLEPKAKKRYLYHVMEYVNGVPITHWAKQRPNSSLTDRLNVIGQLVKAVRSMHRKETLHQDLKPENILVDQKGVVKLIDFGACYVYGLMELSVPLVRDLPLGTAEYSAPEHVLRQSPDTRSDLFSLAAVSYEILTGKQAYQGRLINCHSMQDYARLVYESSYRHNPHIPIWMDGALKKALHITAELRYQDVSEFLHDLTTPNPIFLQESQQPFIQRHPLRFWKILSALLFVVNITALVILLE